MITGAYTSNDAILRCHWVIALKYGIAPDINFQRNELNYDCPDHIADAIRSELDRGGLWYAASTIS